MYLKRIFHRTSFKHKLFFGICLFFLMYFCFNDSSLVSHLKIRILGNFSSNGGIYSHQFGQIVTNRNGSFMNFNLPSLNDFNIERDFYKLNPLGKNESQAGKYCSRRGAESAKIKGDNLFYCVCKSDYSGKECAIPSLVYKTVHKNFTSKISRLRKPRRILLSLIWLTYDYSYGNETSKQIRLDRFSRAFESMSQYVDLFIIHEIILASNLTAANNDKYSLTYQFKHGSLAKHAQYSLLFSNVVTNGPKTNYQSDLVKLEFDLMRKSWQVFTNRITEYRPEDFLIFFSINNLPKEELLLYLKYHAGLMDIIHLKPIYATSIYTKNNTIRVSSEIDHSQYSKLNYSFTDLMKKSQALPSDLYLYNLKNVIVTFEFITYLCGFNFVSFYTKFCLTDQPQIAHFQKYFWPINLINVGNDKLNFSSTFTLV